MGEFVDTVLSFPTVVFTVLLGASLVLWGVTSVVGGDLADDLDTDVDADLDGADGGALTNALRMLGLGGLPPLLVVTLVSLFGWLVSVVLSTVLGDRSAAVTAVVGTIILVVAVVAGGFVAGQVARPLRPLFAPDPPPRRHDLVGELCTITTGRVDASFGQAEVRRADGSSLVVQVRCTRPNELTHGSRALIYAIDEPMEVFEVSPDIEGLEP